MAKSVLLALTALLAVGCARQEPSIDGLQPRIRLLTDEQYRNIVRDVFGPQIAIGSAPDPIMREGGLIAASSARATVSASGLERLAAIGDGVARQVVDPGNRELFVPCVPTSPAARDDACAARVLAQTGRLLFRRNLADTELQQAVALSGSGAEALGDFYAGLAKGLSFQLLSPHFLFVQDRLREDGRSELTPESKATRLSFFLWNTTPDQALLDAAARGELDNEAGVRKQVQRLLDSPRSVDGVRAFFEDMLHFERFDTLAKDSDIYPAFDAEVTADAREQLLRTITWHLIESNEDYRELFRTRQTFMTESLGRIYRVPVPDTRGWNLYEFPQSDGRAGIQTLAGFVAPYSHPGRSSPTLRGRAVRELLLCQRVPDPPANVDFSAFATPDARGLPARERLAAHNSAPACTSCHKVTDPIGLALENFDGAGQARAVEAGKPIDVSGDLDGESFSDVNDFSMALSEHPALPTCLVDTLAAYALAGGGNRKSNDWNAFLSDTFRQSGYRLRPLLEALATSPNFFTVERPDQRALAGRREDRT